MEALFTAEACASSSGNAGVQKLLSHVSGKQADPRVHQQVKQPPPGGREQLIDQRNRLAEAAHLNPREAAMFDSIFAQKLQQQRQQHIQQEIGAFGGAASGSWSRDFDNGSFSQQHVLQEREFAEMEKRFMQHSLDSSKAIPGDNELMATRWSQELSQFDEGKLLNEAFAQFQEFNSQFPSDAGVVSGIGENAFDVDEYFADNTHAVGDIHNHRSTDDITQLSGDDWAAEYMQSRVPAGPYPFEPANPFMTRENPLELARTLRIDGNLTDAALAYEAHLQRIDQRDVQAWCELGMVQAENEKEQPAILALQQCLEIDPVHQEALLALSVGYTNEGFDDEAYRLLYRWTCGHYQRPLDPALDTVASHELYDRTVDALLENIQRLAPNVDADAQIALGLAFYNSGQHEKSIDCFRTALSVRPKDYTLWNRVGATLANSGQSEQAIDAYFQALDIKPSYVRARYNLGVSCMNIGCYKDAAEHFLGALCLCGSGGRNVADNVWETLRRCFVLMERNDLVDQAKNGAPIEEFRKHFTF